MNIKKITLASAILLASTGFAFAQNASGHKNNSNAGPSSQSECLDMNIPLDQLPEKCKAERDVMHNNEMQQDTTGSTTQAPDGTVLPEENNSGPSEQHDNTTGNTGGKGSGN